MTKLAVGNSKLSPIEVVEPLRLSVAHSPGPITELEITCESGESGLDELFTALNQLPLDSLTRFSLRENEIDRYDQEQPLSTHRWDQFAASTLALRFLNLEIALGLDHLSHEHALHVCLVGPVLSENQFRISLNAAETLKWQQGQNVHGCVQMIEWLQPLFYNSGQLPRLRHLDLTEFLTEDAGDLVANVLAPTELLPQLSEVGLSLKCHSNQSKEIEQFVVHHDSFAHLDRLTLVATPLRSAIEAFGDKLCFKS